MSKSKYSICTADRALRRSHSLASAFFLRAHSFASVFRNGCFKTFPAAFRSETDEAMSALEGYYEIQTALT